MQALLAVRIVVGAFSEREVSEGFGVALTFVTENEERRHV